MSDKKRKIFLGIVLVVAVIWGYYNGPWSRTASKPIQPKASSDAQKQAPVTASNTAGPQDIKKQPTRAVSEQELELIRKSSWGLDPFFRASKKHTAKTKSEKKRPIYRLKGIVYNETSPSAFINKQAVRIGDTIDGATVIKINQRSVTLKYGSEVFTIKVSRG